MLAATATEDDDGTASSYRSHPLPAVVHWIVGALLVLVGLATMVGGSALTFVVDRAMIEQGIADGTIEAEGLTEAEAVEVLTSLAQWTGVGLLAVGAGLVIVAVWYALVQRRRENVAGEDGSSYFWTSALLGAVVSALLSFIPFSPIVGGAAAGYLEKQASGRALAAGAVSGVLAMAPLVVLTAFVLVGVTLGLLALETSGLAILVVAVLLLVSVFVAAIGAGLGALGGYVGGRLVDDDRGGATAPDGA